MPENYGARTHAVAGTRPVECTIHVYLVVGSVLVVGCARCAREIGARARDGDGSWGMGTGRLTVVCKGARTRRDGDGRIEAQ